MKYWLGLTFALALACPVRASLIHRYTFDGGATDQAGSDNGTLLNGATVSGGVLNLDGVDDYVQFSAHLVPTSGSRSYALFARQLSLQSNFIELISQGGSGSALYLGHDPSHNIRAGDNWLSTGVPFPTDGQMHHYALVYDAGAANTRLYVDGSLAATLNSLFNTGVSGDDTRLGRQYDGHAEFFHGQIDDVRVFDSALSDMEVAALVPEPAAATLIMVGMILIGPRRRRA